MKKINLAITAALAFASINFANAQMSTDNAISSNNDYAYNATTGESIGNAATSVNEKALKNFAKKFSATASWYEAKEGTLVASFTNNDVQTRVSYSKEGNWLYTVKHYGANGLPSDVLGDVEFAYSFYTINSVDEVDSYGDPVYVVHLESKKDFITLIVCNGSMVEKEHFNKL